MANKIDDWSFACPEAHRVNTAHLQANWNVAQTAGGRVSTIDVTKVGREASFNPSSDAAIAAWSPTGPSASSFIPRHV